MRAWNRYWFAPGSHFDLAVCRIVIAGTQLLLVASGDVASVAALLDLPEEFWSPLPAYEVLTLSLDGGTIPSVAVASGVYYLALVAGVLSVLGIFTNASLGTFAAASLYWSALNYSFSDFHHPEALVMVALVVLALGPSGQRLSIDAWRRRSRSEPLDEEASKSSFARWPILVIQWMLVIVYLDAAINKAMSAGLDWANGYTLRWSLYRHGLERGNELALWLADQHMLSVVLSWVTLFWESTFILAVLFPVLGLLYVPLGVALHAGMCLTDVACFWGFMAAYSTLVPWSTGRDWISSLAGSGVISGAVARVANPDARGRAG